MAPAPVPSEPGGPVEPSPEAEPAVVVVRRTRAQWVVGALGWSLCAAPVAVGAFLADGATPALLVMAAVAAVVAVALDLLVRRDVRVEVTPSALRFRSRVVPWWAVDEVTLRRRLGVRTVTVTAFGTEQLTLPAPRTGPLVRNRRFDEDAAVLLRAWRSLHGERRRPGDRADGLPGRAAGGGEPGGRAA